MKIKEFRSVAEAAPALLDALAKGGNVARDSLKKMSQDGLLTTKFVADALQKSMLDLIVATEGIPKTVGQAFQNLSTGFQFFIGELNKTYGITEGLSGIISELASGMVNLGKSLQDGKFQEVTNNLLIMTGVIAGASSAFYLMDAANKSANISLLEYVKNLRIATGAQALFNIVAAANPYVILAATIIGVATALYSMRNATVEVGGATVSIGSLIISTFESLKERVGSAFIFITESYKKITKGLQDIFVGLFNFLKDTIAGKILGALVDAFANTLKALGQIGIRFAKALGLDKLTEQFNSFVSDLGQDIVIGAVVRDSKSAKPEAVNPFLGGNGTATAVETEATKKLREERERLAEQNAEFRKNYLAETELLKSVNDFIAQGLPLKEAELAAQRKVDEQKAISAGLTKQQVVEQYALRDAIVLTSEAEKIISETYKEINDEKVKGMELSKKALEDFLKPEDFKVGDLFGDASKGAGALINAFQDIIKQQEEYAKIRDGIYETEIQRKDALSKADKKQSQNEIRNIGNILGATKGFFKEKSAGYKVLSAAEKAFRLIEIAEAVKTFAIKQGFISAETGAYVAGSITKKVTETGFTAFTIAQKGIQATASGIAALASSMAGLPFPLNLAAFAATGALLASIGIGLGGGKKSGSFAPTNEGTGTVFGDKDAKSESIKRSIDLLAENSKVELPITSAMLISLQNIEGNIGGVANLLIRNNGGVPGSNLSSSVKTGTTPSSLTKGVQAFGTASTLLGGSIYAGALIGGTAFINAIGPLIYAALGPIGIAVGAIAAFIPAVGKVIGSITGALFGKTKTSIKGQGLFAGPQALGDVVTNGLSLKDYVDIQIKKKSIFSSSTKNKTITSQADAELARQFSLIFTGFYDAVKLAAVPLGENLSEVTNKLDNFVLNIGKINLKGLKGEEIQEKLEAVFGAAADSIAQAALPGLEDFQKVGEGYFETVVRVSSGIEQAAQALREFGIAAVNFKDIVNTQGNVGIEIVRQSLLNKEIASQVTTRQIGTITVDRTTQAKANKAVQDTINTLTAAGFKNIAVTPEFVTTTTREFIGSFGTLLRSVSAPVKQAQAVFGELFTGLVERVGSNFFTTITAVSGEIDFAYDVVSTKLTGIGEIIKSFTGDSVEELVSLVKELYNLRDLQRGFGVVVADVSVAMIQAAGSFDAFKDGVESFYENFTTPQEKIASQTNILTREFARLGLQLPSTRDAYKNLVLTAANNTSVAGQEMYGSLIRLSPLFVELREAIEDVGGSAEDVGQSLNDVAKNLYQTIADARSKALTPTQSVDFLLGQFREAQALALSQNGQSLATTAGDINSQINPLLEAIKEVYASGTTAQRLIDEVLGGAKVVADRAATEAFTFQDESLRLLQVQVNELEAIRIAIQSGMYSPQNIVASAMGNAFSSGNVVPFAKGGAFTNSIVSSPTLAPMALFGEKNPEAIMPLARGSDGSLGVRIVGGGSSSAGVESKLDESNRQSAALVRLQQEANKRIIEKLSAMEERLGGLESAARLEAAS